jgi:dolichol-phosphate mannosyltransferase
MSTTPRGQESSIRRVSFIVPILNEEGALKELVERIMSVMREINATSYEILLVDDGSTDGSWRVVEKLSKTVPNVTGYRLRRNFGKATALAVGVDMAAGSIVVTLDADLQDDPSEIPRLLSKLDEGYDLVSGWKENRQDPLNKILASRLFNLTVRSVTRVQMRDFNCGFKAARREVYHRIPLYGELHRFIPVLADDLGYRVVEIPVRHHARVGGQTKYGAKRLIAGFLDLLTVLTITRFSHRPGHLFGGIGLLIGLLGMGILAYLALHWLLLPDPIGSRPLLIFGVLLTLLSAQFLVFGMVAELILFRSRPESFGQLIGQVARGAVNIDPPGPAEPGSASAVVPMAKQVHNPGKG